MLNKNLFTLFRTPPKLRSWAGKALLFALLAGAGFSSEAANWYAKPKDGLTADTGDGSQANPWDLSAALVKSGTIKPGDTLWLMGGTYHHSFVNGGTYHYNYTDNSGTTKVPMATRFFCTLYGAAGQPITVRAMPGQRVTLDGNLVVGSPTGTTAGGYLRFQDLEIANLSNNNRFTTTRGSFPQDWYTKVDGQVVSTNDWCVSGFTAGATANAVKVIPGVELINCMIHDNVGGGIGTSMAFDGISVYGCLVYYNGWESTADRSHGHGVYAQNLGPNPKLFKNTMLFMNAANGIQVYGSGNSGDPADYVTLDGVISFQNGHIGNPITDNAWDLEVGCPDSAHMSKNSAVINSMTWDTGWCSTTASSFGDGGGLVNFTLTNNYFSCLEHTCTDGTVATPLTGITGPISGMNAQGNTFVHGINGASASSYPNNTYLNTAPTTGLKVNVSPNAYEAGRANIGIINWSKAPTVTVDVSNVGLNVGDQYELHQVEDYFNDVTYGTYNGSPITVPMTGHTVSKPVGTNMVTLPSTFPTFGAFVIKKASGTNNVPPPVQNTAPVISSISNQTVNQGTATAAIPFTVSDAETAASSLTVTASSSNTTLVPNANIVLGGSGTNRTVTVTPAANQSGTATITLKVSDGTTTTSGSFQLTVNVVATSNPPTISTISAQTTSTGIATSPIAFTIGDSDTAVSSLTVTGSSSNPTLVPNANIVLGGSGTNRTVTVTPAANQSGTATITLTVSDGVKSATSSFALTVSAPTVNHPPTISSIGNQTVTTNQSTAPITFSVSDPDSAATSLSVKASSSNTTLVPNANVVLAGTGSTRTVTVTPAANQTGTATITLTVSDGSLSANTSFTVTVTGGNTQQNPGTNTNQFVHLGFEAESGVMAAPMTVLTNAQNPAIKYIASSTANSGTATYTINIPTNDTYVMWFKVLAPTYASDSFYVSVDGQEDVFDAAEGKQTNAFQWSELNGRNGGSTPLALNPRTFNFTQGTHTIVIRGREVNAGVDRVIVTNDRNYVPKDVVATDDTVTAYPGSPTLIMAADLVRNDVSMFDDSLTISAVGTATNGSVALTNGAINYTPKAGFVGNDTFTYTVTDGMGGSSTATVTVNVQAPQMVYLGFEAESGAIVAPMTVATNAQSTGGKSIWTTTANSGTATYSINIPKADTYVMWCKILAPTYASDSFFVSVDGQEDVFDAAEGKQTNAWQWSEVNGRNGGSIPLALNPRTFNLTQGTHTIVVRGREVKTGMDRIIVTDDRNYVPKDITATADTVNASSGAATQILASTLLQNDTSLFADPLTITAVGTAQNGTVTLSGTTINYTPKAGFVGTDTFTYTVTDGQGGSATATVTVNVQ